VAALAEHSKAPARILDLCASPGGKLLAAHDLFPQAKLYANDVSPEKIMRLSQNLAKYGVKADLNCGQGEDYQSSELFDLIILDVPCSNSGVLNKRPEARWRLTPKVIEGLRQTQSRLVKHAADLLAPGGVIWYLTCSILKSENEEMIEDVIQHDRLEKVFSKIVLPNYEGWDGGFGCVLRKCT